MEGSAEEIVLRSAVKGLGGSGEAILHRELEEALSCAEDAVLATASASDAPEAIRQDGVPSAPAMSEEELRVLSRRFQTRRLSPGEVIYGPDEAAEELYLVAKGTVAVRVHHGDGTPMRLTSAGPGSFLGEMAIFEEARRVAEATAETDAEVFVLPRTRLAALESGHPALHARLKDAASARLAEHLRTATDWIHLHA